jgi:hypothetical protein
VWRRCAGAVSVLAYNQETPGLAHTGAVHRLGLGMPAAKALAGLSHLEALKVSSFDPFFDPSEDRAAAVECAAIMAALPPSLRLLEVCDMGYYAEGAALVVPPGRAQPLEVRCSGPNAYQRFSHFYTGREVTAADVRAFLGWLGPGPRPFWKVVVIGACLAPWVKVGWAICSSQLALIPTALPPGHCSPAPHPAPIPRPVPAPNPSPPQPRRELCARRRGRGACSGGGGRGAELRRGGSPRATTLWRAGAPGGGARSLPRPPRPDRPVGVRGGGDGRGGGGAPDQPRAACRLLVPCHCCCPLPLPTALPCCGYAIGSGPLSCALFLPCRWRDSAVDPGAELERVAGGLPRLERLTLPAEWAIGWPVPAPAGSGPAGPGPGDTAAAATGLGPGGGGPAAAPLARLLLRCRGSAQPPAIEVAFPQPGHREGAALDAAVRGRVERIVRAAAGRAAATGPADGSQQGARLPRVEFATCSDRSYAPWVGWHEGGRGGGRAAKATAVRGAAS